MRNAGPGREWRDLATHLLKPHSASDSHLISCPSPAFLFCILQSGASGRISPLLSEQRRRFRDYLRHSPPRRNQHHDPREKNPHLLRGSSRFSHVPPSNDAKHPPASPSHLR